MKFTGIKLNKLNNGHQHELLRLSDISLSFANSATNLGAALLPINKLRSVAMSYSIDSDRIDISIRECEYLEILNSITLYAEKTKQLDHKWYHRILLGRYTGYIRLTYWNQSEANVYTDLVDLIAIHLAGYYDEEITILKQSTLYITSSEQ